MKPPAGQDASLHDGPKRDHMEGSDAMRIARATCAARDALQRGPETLGGEAAAQQGPETPGGRAAAQSERETRRGETAAQSGPEARGGRAAAQSERETRRGETAAKSGPETRGGRAAAQSERETRRGETSAKSGPEARSGEAAARGSLPWLMALLPVLAAVACLGACGLHPRESGASVPAVAAAAVRASAEADRTGAPMLAGVSASAAPREGAQAGPPPSSVTTGPPVASATTSSPPSSVTTGPPASSATIGPPVASVTTGSPPSSATTNPPVASATTGPPPSGTTTSPSVAGAMASPPASAGASSPAAGAVAPGPAPRARQQPAGLMEAHGHGAPPREGPSPVPAEPTPEAVLLVSAHTAGWITPCGCAGSQAGGVARRAGYGALLRQTYPGLPVYHFDLGGFMTYGSRVQRATSEAVIEAMTRIGYEAVNVAAGDLSTSFGEEEFLRTRFKIPRFSANVVFHDTGELAFPPYRIVTVTRPAAGTAAGGTGAGGADEPGSKSPRQTRIGILGLLDGARGVFAFGSQGRSLIVKPMEEALKRYLPELRARCDVVILLAEVAPDRLSLLLPLLTGIDLIVAGQGTQFLTEPLYVGQIPVIAVGNQGKYMAEIRVYEKEGKPAIKPFVHWLDERFPEDTSLGKFAEQNIDRINEMSRLDLAEDTSPPSDIAPFVGAEACASCHQKAWDTWKASQHARAFQTLVSLKRDYTVSCVYCHVSGTGVEEGGFVSVKATPQLVNVQCEQCHGPGASHLAEPGAPYGTVPQDMCIRCHSPATDPSFDRAVRWPAIAH